MDSVKRNKTILKNTIYMYIRMALLMFVTLYTSRMTLRVLGEEDFGIYNVVAGVVVLFAIFNNALTSGVQRYINYYTGRNNTEMAKSIFAVSFYSFIVLSFIIILLSETIGLVLLEKYLIIPESRMIYAKIVYQLAIATTVFSMLRVPFNAVIIAYEKMSFYAYTSIIEGVLKLLSAYLLTIVKWDSLVQHSVNYLMISILLLFVYWIYCKNHFQIINFKNNTDKNTIYELLAFSGWNIVGSSGNIVCNQGLNLLINHFFGVTANAAMGIANQVNHAVYSFLTSFQTAFNPQIVKLYAQKEIDETFSLITKTSKLSFMLVYLVILPLINNLNFILCLWLGKPPEHSGVFIQCLCIYTMLDSLSGPLWMLAEAEGNIKKYQIYTFISGIVVLPLAAVAYQIGLSASCGLMIHNCTIFGFMIWRLFYLRERTGFPIVAYCKDVYLRIIAIIGVSLLLNVIKNRFIILPNDVINFFVSCFISVVILIILYSTIGLNRNERRWAVTLVMNKIRRL